MRYGMQIIRIKLIEIRSEKLFIRNLYLIVLMSSIRVGKDMPHRLRWFSSETQVDDPLQNFEDPEFVLDFEDAGQILQQWRDPKLGRASREGMLLTLASKNLLAIENITERLKATPVAENEARRLLEELKVLRYLSTVVYPMTLERINLEELVTPEDILKFIENMLSGEETPDDISHDILESKLYEMEEITDIEVKDSYGATHRISRDNVMDVLGRIVGSFLIKQFSLLNVPVTVARRTGHIHFRDTYKAAMLSDASVPPKSIREEDMRVLKRDRASWIYLIIDMSQSMNKKVFEGKMTRLDGALITALGLQYYFQLANRRYRRRGRQFKLAVVPISPSPRVVLSDDEMKDMLQNAQARGKTPMARSVLLALDHASQQHRDRHIDAHLVILTDGQPNIQASGSNNENVSQSVKSHFMGKDSKTKLSPAIKQSMLQMHSILQHIKYQQDRNWKISYFLIGPEKMKNSQIYFDTLQMLRGISHPIMIDVNNLDRLGEQILLESLGY